MESLTIINGGASGKKHNNPSLIKGDHFTVIEWTSHRDNSYKGDCLRVECVDENLIRFVNIENEGGFLGGERTIDLNCVIVRKLSDEFVRRVQSCIQKT